VPPDWLIAQRRRDFLEIILPGLLKDVAYSCEAEVAV
jgi:hypothetical protein